MQAHDIIVIGASAGGVEAIKQLVSELPPDLPATIFLVIHFPARTPSVLPQILQTAGPLPASQAHDGEKFKPAHIYLPSSDHHLLLKDGTMHLVHGPRENLHRPAINPLFRTAARVYGRRVVGVVLSGNQDDGTVGLQLIKAHGGVTIAQNPDEALYPEMPRSAIKNVGVDYVLCLSQIAAKLVQLAHEPVAGDDVPPMPKDIDYESRIDELDRAALEDAERPGAHLPFACPECGGVLWEIHSGEIVSFRCRVGHTLTARALMAKQAEAVEPALWAALATLEENISLSKYMAARARKRGLRRVAQRYDEHTRTNTARVDLIREALLRGNQLLGDVESESEPPAVTAHRAQTEANE